MNDIQRYSLLHGPYRPEDCAPGDRLWCERYGQVVVKAFSAGPISWPLGRPASRPRGRLVFVLCGELVRAVRHESNQAVARLWGVRANTVTAWRKALDVPMVNEGTDRLKREWFAEVDEAVKARARALANSPECVARRAAARRGKPRPPGMMWKLSRSNVGRRASPDSRRKMSESHRRRGTRPPRAGRPWPREEESLLGTVPDAEVARRTGRTVMAVKCRRARLGIPSHRRRHDAAG